VTQLQRATTTSHFETRAPKLGFIAGFDGIRGVFVIMMITEHIFPGNFESFSLVLDAFFLMSAFLIVSLLMQEQRENGAVNMKKFYQRRAVRLLPSAYLHFVVWLIIGAVVTAAGVRVDGRNLLVEVCKDVAAAFTYTYHLVFPVGLAAVAPDEGLRPMGHLWSLSVEEQFYVIVAITVVVCLRRNWMRQLAVVCAVTSAYIVWSRYHMDLGPWPGSDVSDSIWSRGLQLLWMQRPDALLIGVVVAVINAYLPAGATERWRAPLKVMGWLGFLLLAFTLIWSSEAAHKLGWPFYIPNLPDKVSFTQGVLQCRSESGVLTNCGDTTWFFRIGHNFSAISIAPVMFCLARFPEWLPNKILGFKLFRTLGRMSYTLYVWHILAILAVTGAVENSARPVQFVVKLAAVFAVSWPVYHFVEQKALKRKIRYSAEKQTLDLSTGKMVDTEAVIAAASAKQSKEPKRPGREKPPFRR